MIRKIYCSILKIIIPIIIYLLQIYVFNIQLFYGVKANICVIYILMISIFYNINQSVIYAVLFGIISDVLFSNIVGKYIIIYVLIVLIATSLKKRYKEDSKMMLILYSLYGTIIFNIVESLFSFLSDGTFVNIFSFVLLLLKESVINISLMFLIYIVCKKIYKDE